MRQRITPFLWYDGQAEEAARFYVEVFGKDARITKASPLSVEFELQGQPFVALNGGPMFKFTEATSFYIDCKDQREVDHFWNRLGEGGTHGRCGWLKDRWGLSWQVIPRALPECLNGKDRAGAKRAMDAMLGMNKLDVAQLKAAYRGAGGAAKTTTRPSRTKATAKAASKRTSTRGAPRQ